jgi:hypothetical protein
MRQLPRFGLDDYEALLRSLKTAGYEFRPVTALASYSGGKVVYLRHDVDLHLALVEQMAEIEAKMGRAATYYVLLTSHYNVLYPENQSILHHLVELGHEIGLHYDMGTYPEDREQARAHLDWEVSVLSKVVGKPVRTICMHQPHQGHPDPFRELDEYIHPHDPRYQHNLLYISDSCRAWRDESLLTCFGPNPPWRVMLSIHPELWLDGSIADRFVYLNEVLLENGLRQSRRYFEETVRQVWERHPATKLHDARERKYSNK